MIKELVFSGKKYFEGQIPSLVGKNVKIPEKTCSFFLVGGVKSGEGDITNLKFTVGKGDDTTTSHSVKLNGLTAQIVSQISGTVVDAYGHTPFIDKIMNTYQTFIMVRFTSSINFVGDYNRYLNLTELLQNGGEILP